MNLKPLSKMNTFHFRHAVVNVFIKLVLLVLPVSLVSAAPFAVLAIDGDGTLTVSPTSAVYATTTTFTFTFTADSGDFEDGSQAVISIPSGWTSPSNSGAGRVILASHTCTLRSPGAEIAGFTSSSVSVDFGCAQGETFTVTYSDAKPYKVADSPYTFSTTTEVPGGVAPALIANSPTIDVTPKTVTISATALTANNKVYNGNTNATLTVGDLSLTGVVPGDVVSLNAGGATGTFSDKHVGTGKDVAVAGLTLTGADATSYSLTQPTLSANITARPITVTAAADTKVYDGTASSSGVPTLSLGTPLASGDSAPTWTQTFDNKHVGAGKTLTPAGTVNDGNGGANYSYNFVTNTSGEIMTRSITVTAVSSSKVYDGTTNSSGTPVLSAGTPLAPGDTEPTWTQSFDNKNVGTGKTLTPAGAVNDGNGGANYAYTFTPNITGEITVKPITVTADPKSKVFGEADPALTYQVSPALFAGDAFIGALSRTAGEAPGVYPIAKGALSAGGNYDISFTGANLTIKPVISGSAGMAGVTLTYNDGGIKTVQSGTGGEYSLAVSYGWSGIVTPSFTGYVFLPSTISYINVTSNQTGMNYVAGQERAKNGGFNIYVGTSKIPRYWQAVGFAPTDGKNFTKKEGATSVKIGGAPGVTKSLTQTLALSGASGDIFTFSFWVKGSSIPTAGICQAQVLIYNGTTLKATKTINCNRGTYGFRQKKLTFTTTSAYTKVKIKFTYAKSSGAAWFDAVSLLK